MIENFRYRPDIDGLRAIAVLVVVMYHAGFGFPGGFVGVDVFFVISGYLITSLIWKDLENDRFTFSQFWARRARRIVPPLVVVTLAALVAGWFILLPLDFKSLGRAAAAQSIFMANVHYWLDSGYFSTTAHEKPLLHTWSLAVEEQFYFIAPFILWGMNRLRTNRLVTILILVSGFSLSFAASIYGVSKAPSATFYLLPTRAWELLMGSILAFLPVVQIQRFFREGLALIGLVLILVPVFVYSNETPFPGMAALFPCLGTSFLIYANYSPTKINSFLSARSVVFIGLISYSLYLWHWIFFAFANYLTLTPLSSITRLFLIALGFLFAYLSWKYVETPFRTRQIASSQKSVLIFASAGLIVVFVGGIVSILLQGFPERFSPEKVEFAKASTDMSFINELTVEDVQEGNLVVIGLPDAAPTVLVWGDSHAMAAMPAFDGILKEKGLGGRAVTHSLNPPTLGWYVKSRISGLNEDSIPFNTNVIKYIKDHQISDVVLCAAWNVYREHDEKFHSALLNTIKEITANGARPWVLLSVPSPTFDVPKALSRTDFTADQLESFYPPPEEFDAIFINQMRAAGAQILDPKPAFLSLNGQHLIQLDGIAIYRDDHHLSTKGALLILQPFLRERFSIDN